MHPGLYPPQGGKVECAVNSAVAMATDGMAQRPMTGDEVLGLWP